MKERNKSTLYGLWDFPKRGKSAHLMCASLNAPWLWGFALHALEVLAIITALLIYSIVVYNYIRNIWYMRVGLIFSNLKYPFLGYERK